jgi:peptide/nickel transport system permease protein
MVRYIVQRLILAVLTVWAISVLSFIIIHLPPGDYVTSYIAYDVGVGERGVRRRSEGLREQLGLDKPIHGPVREVDGAHAAGQLRHGDG